MQALILGDGPFGRAVADALAARGVAVRLAGRPAAGGHDPAAFAGVDVVVDASRGESVLGNVAAAVEGGVRRFAIATTAWEPDRRAVAELLRARGASAVAASNFSPGALVFAQLAEMAARLTARLPGYEPYIVEWHRHGKADRPSGTARDLARRILAVDPARDRVSTPADGPAETGNPRGRRGAGGHEPGPAPRGLRRPRRDDRAHPDRPGPGRVRLGRRCGRRLAPRRSPDRRASTRSRPSSRSTSGWR